MKRVLFVICLITSALTSFAQASVEAKISPIEMMIGEQAQVTISVQADENAKVEFPTFKPRQELVPGVEVLDAQRSSDYTLTLILTSFDGNLYHLPPFKVKVNGKELKTADLALKVVEVEVDTTKMDQFYGPKDVQDVPFQWSDLSLSFWLSVLLLVLIALNYYLYLRLRDNKPIITHIKIVKRLLPHQKAMKEIEQIKADKMVSSENQKEYYTKLTDTLRRYIEERYGFSAMEMTSSEIIDRLMQTDQQSLDEMINENDANLVNAIDFINQTKQENQPTETVEKPQLSEADLRSQSERRVLKTVIWSLVLLLLIPYLIWYLMYRKKSEPTMRMSDTMAYRYAPRSWKVTLMPVQQLLRIAVFVLVVLVLARPQTQNSWKNKTMEGIDIMLAMDVSTSMLAEDLKPNRMEAAKQVAAEFITGRPNDNIGLTIFAGEAFTQCPMTTDHASLLNLLQNVRTDIAQRGLIEDGTAIGMGLANAVSRLKDSKAKSRVVILLTDGSNNRGDLSPMTAAEIAKSFGIRVYTIGVGTNKVAPYPMTVAGGVQYVNIPVEIDTKTLSGIAEATNGDFYRATNNKELQQIYKEIDKLEKSKLNVKKFSKRYEAYQPFAIAAALLLLLEMLLRITVFRKLP